MPAMTTSVSRRSFIAQAAAAASLAAVGPGALFAQSKTAKPLFKISLAEWSLHRELQKKMLDNLDFAKVTRTVFNIDAIEYVNQFFKDKAEDAAYLAEPALCRVAAQMTDEHFERLSPFLHDSHWEATNNDAERFWAQISPRPRTTRPHIDSPQGEAAQDASRLASSYETVTSFTEYSQIGYCFSYWSMV